MADSEPAIVCELDADLAMECIRDGQTVASASIKTADDGALCISTSGKLPRASFQQLRQANAGLHQLVELTGKDVQVDHNGDQLLAIKYQSPGKSRLALRWWAAFKYWLGRD